MMSASSSVLALSGTVCAQRLVRVGQVAQHQALGAGQPVERDELAEGHRPLAHVAHHGLRRQLVRRRPTGGSAGRSRRRRRAARRAASDSVTSSSSSIRSSYSMPSAFIAATASPRALNCCAPGSGAGRRASPRSPRRRRARSVSDSGSSTSTAASANVDSGWLSAKFGRQVDGQPAPCGRSRPAASSRSTTPAVQQRRGTMPIACADLAALAPRGSWLSVSSVRIAANGSPGRATTLSIIAWRHPHAASQRLGRGVDQPVKVDSLHGTDALRGLLAARRLRRFFGSSPTLANCLRVLDLVLGRLDDDGARGVVAGPAGPPGDLVELAGAEHAVCGCRRTWTAPVNTTVRIGTLMPTPRVSVPQMTLSRPAWASCSTSRRYFGSIPAWCTPMPCRTSRDSVLPKPAAKRNPPISSAIASRSLPAGHVDAQSAPAPARAPRPG